MAQFNTGNNAFQAQAKTLFEVNLIANGNNGLVVSETNPFPVTTRAGGSGSSAFGEALMVEPTCVVQIDAIYGLGLENSDQFQTYSALGGDVTTEDNMFKVSSSSTQYSYGVFRSKRFLRYRPGQGAVGRFAAKFDTPLENTSQRAGLFNQENGLMVGYDGTTFGILHQYGGRAHVEQLTITGAPSTSTNATLTLNGVAYTIPLVAGETVSQTAARIARFPITGWLVDQRGDRVVFLATDLSTKSGAFTFSHANATGTMTARQTAIAATEHWIPQAEWNGDINFTIDPQTFNVYQVQYRWLGAGIIRFSMEHPDTGDLVTIHTIHWVNRNTTLHLTNPSMKIGLVSYNLGGGATTVYGGSMMMAIEGQTIKNDYPRSTTGDKTGLVKDVIHHLVSIQNPITRIGKINTKEVILQDLTISTQGSDPVELFLFLNGVQATGNHVFQEMPDTLATKCTETITYTAGVNTPLIIFTSGINGTQQFELQDYRIVLSPGDVLSVACRSGQSISRAISSLTWVAD